MHYTSEQLKASIETAVRDLFKAHTPAYLIYHNLHHTEQVVGHSIEIAAHYELSPDELFTLFAAAWFHDTGHLFTTAEKHEAESIALARQFFRDKPDVPASIVNAIAECILATKMPQSPQTLVASILCDADLYHLGTAEFCEQDAQVKEEFIRRGGNVDHWEARALVLLQTHRYHTSYCRKMLDAGKQRNIALLRQH